MSEKANPEFLSRKQAAEFLCIGLQLLDKLIRARQLPAVKIGAKCVRIRRSDLIALVDSNSVAPPDVKQRRRI
jgi:excisionase family DNA binding protein